MVQEERVSLPVDLEVHSEEHNYSLQSELDTESSQGTDCDIGEEEKGEEDEKEEGREAMEEVKEKEELQPHVRPKKRWCYWECSLYSEADLGRDGERDSRRDEGKDEEKDGDIIWGPSNLPSTMCLIGGTSTNGETPRPTNVQWNERCKTFYIKLRTYTVPCESIRPP